MAKITKYASHTCVKCKILDKMLKQLNIEPDETIYTEDVDIDELTQRGIMSLPTLIIDNGKQTYKLSGAITAKDIKQCLDTK